MARLNSEKIDGFGTKTTAPGGLGDSIDIQVYPKISRLTVVSREAKKKQHACASSGPRDHYSELFTRMAALKF